MRASRKTQYLLKENLKKPNTKKEEYQACVNYVDRQIFSFYREQNYDNLFDNRGIVAETIPDNFGLTHGNVFPLIVMPELLTQFHMETKNCSYKEAIKQMNKSDEIVTVFHIGLLLQVPCVSYI